MKTWLKITGVVAMTGLVLYGGSVATNAARDGDGPEVLGDGLLIHAGMNSDGLEGVVEGSASFMVNIPFQKILENFQNPGTLGQIGGDNVRNYTVDRQENDDHVVYKTVQEIVPFKVAFVEMDPSQVGIDYYVNKRALGERVIFVKYELNPSVPGNWERLSGRIYAADLHNGHTMVLLTTSTKSKYSMPQTIRKKLVKKYLASSKDNILKWLGGL